MKHLATALAACALLWTSATRLEAQPKKEPKYRGKPIAYWVERLANDKGEDRYAALKAVQAFDAAARSKAVPILTEMLEDRDPEFRVFAADALGELTAAPGSAVPALAAALADDTLHVRAAAAKALRSFGTAARAAAPALVKLLSGEKEHWPASESIQTLAEIAPGDEAALNAMKQVYLSPPGEQKESGRYWWRRSVITALGKMGPAGQRLLIEFLEGYVARVREWGNADDEYRVGNAREICQQLVGAKAKPAAAALTRLLEHKDRELRRDAAWALWQAARHSKCVPTLSSCLVFSARPPTPTIRKQNDVDREVLRYLAEIGPAAQEAMPTLAQVLETIKNDRESLLDSQRSGGTQELRDLVIQTQRKIAPEKYGRTP